MTRVLDFIQAAVNLCLSFKFCVRAFKNYQFKPVTVNIKIYTLGKKNTQMGNICYISSKHRTSTMQDFLGGKYQKSSTRGYRIHVSELLLDPVLHSTYQGLNDKLL